jgi:hypothetical protein
MFLPITSWLHSLLFGFRCFNEKGLFLIFAVVGVAAWTLRNLLLPVISVFELAAAVLVIFMGLQILMRSNFLSFHLQATAPQPKSFAGLFFFGVAYGLAAVGCSAPIFLFYTSLRHLHWRFPQRHSHVSSLCHDYGGNSRRDKRSHSKGAVCGS